MLKTLLKKQMAEIFRNYFYDPKKNKMRSRGATIAYIALYVLLMAGVLGGMFALLAVGICAPMAAAGVGWLYYLVMGLIAVLLGAFGSVFSTYSSLYLSKDNDLLLSMPIPVRYVMASRLLGVYLLGLMYSGVATVPAVIVYWIVAPVTAGTIVGGVLMVLLVSVIVMVLSCLLGWVVARISLKLKNKSFITVILSLAFLAAYYFVYYKAQGLITLLAENAAVYGAKIRGSAYLLYLFGSVGAGDWLAMLIVTLSQAALLALTLWVIARSFLKIATATGSVKKVRFEHRVVRAQSVQRALRRKELRRFAASPNYMLNCGLGIVMLPAAGIALLIKGRARAAARRGVRRGGGYRAGAAERGAVPACVDERHGGAVGVARGQAAVAGAVAAGHAVAGAACKARHAAAADRRADAVLRAVRGDHAAGRRGGDGAGRCRGAAVHAAERAGGTRARAQAAEPDLDQRDHAHQAGRQRDARALCQLVLCHRARRAVLPVRQIFERGGVSRARCRRDGGRLCAAAALGETARHAHLRRALS